MNTRITKPTLLGGILTIVLVGICLRPAIVSIGPILPLIIASFGMSHAGASLLTAIPDLLMGLLALPAPWLAHRFGRDRTIVTALALLAVSTLLRAFAPGIASLLLTTVGVGAGIAIAGTLLSGYVKASYPDKAALMMGVYVTSLSLGSTVSAMITAPMAQAFAGWRVPAGIWAILGVIATLTWVMVLRQQSRLQAASPLQPATRAALPWKDGTAWKVAIYFACVNLIFYAMVAWTATVFLEYGQSSNIAGILLGVFTATFMLASPVIGTLSRSLDRRPWLVASSALTLAGLTSIALAPTLSPILIVALTAFGLGGAFTLAMTLPLDNTVDASATNAWTAFVLTIGYLIASTGPLAFGYLRDLTGDFQYSLYLLVLTAVIMTMLAFRLRPVGH